MKPKVVIAHPVVVWAEAVVKRATIVVNTKNNIYMKIGGDDVIHKFDLCRYVTPEAVAHLEHWSATDGLRDFGTRIEQEQQYLKCVFDEQDRCIAGKA